MPTYSYRCLSCSCDFELFFTIKEYNEQPKCIKCKKKSAVERRYTEDVMTQNSSIKKADSELSTIGDLANRNRDRLSTDEKTALHHKHNAYKETPSDKPLPKGMSRMKKPKGKINWRNL